MYLITFDLRILFYLFLGLPGSGEKTANKSMAAEAAGNRNKTSLQFKQ